MRAFKHITTLLALLLLLSGPALAQTSPKKYLSANTTNSTLVFAAKGLLGAGVVVNTNSALYYLKFYDKATAPTCGTDTPVWTIPIPYGTSSSGGGFVLPLGDGIIFSKGIGFCITSGIADNDTGAASTGIVVNLGVSGR